MRTRIAVLLILGLALVACGDDEGAGSTTPEATTPSTAAPMTSTSVAPATTATTAGATSAPADLADELRSGTYLVGIEIRVGSWEPDECGCIWAIVAADGTETPGTSEDARVGADDYAVKLGPCTWTFSG